MNAMGARRVFMMCLAIPLFAGMAVAAGTPAFICRLDSVVRFECCCAGGEHGRGGQVAADTGLQPSGCCDVAQIGQRIATPVGSSEQMTDTPGSKAICGTSVVPPATSSFASHGSSGWLASHLAWPIPVLLQKQSLLL
jgi:hypothetical protein